MLRRLVQISLLGSLIVAAASISLLSSETPRVPSRGAPVVVPRRPRPAFPKPALIASAAIAPSTVAVVASAAEAPATVEPTSAEVTRASVDGRVTAASGAPLSVRVVVTVGDQRVEGRSDANGRFSVAAPLGVAIVQAYDPTGFAIAWTAFELGDVGTWVDLAESEPVLVSGVFRADANEPVPSTFAFVGNGGRLEVPLREGAFAVELPPGRYWLDGAQVASREATYTFPRGLSFQPGERRYLELERADGRKGGLLRCGELETFEKIED